MRRITLFLLSLIVLAGCGSSASNDYVLPVAPFSPVTYRIGVLAPLTGGQVEFGRGIRNGAQLAVDQWNEKHRSAGPLFELVAKDDSSDPSVGLASARQLAETAGLTGVVGTYNSGVAAAVQPTFKTANIALISPGNTDPTLTLGQDLSRPVRPYDNYFRLVVPDTLQGPALAEYVFVELGLTEVAIVTEAKSVSQNLADAFATKFTQLGGTVLLREVAPNGTSDYTAILGRIASVNPPALFYAGEIPNASLVREQATGAGILGPLVGGDGVKSQAYIDMANVSTEGDIASSLGAPAELLPSAATFLTSYNAAGFAEPPSDFGPYAYDAANLLIEASVVARGDRSGVISYLQNVDTQGATGRLSFDAFGDTLNRVLTIYTVQAQEFLPIEIVTVNP